MAFTAYSCIDDVVKKHKLRFMAGPVITPAADAPPFSEQFRAELDLNLTDLSPGRSEAGSSEIILFPILREAWKPYREELCLFSHEELAFDGDLCGIPDYFVCRLSEYGRIPVPPYMVVVEAKLDDFERAWGQCLAAMLAAQKLNEIAELPIYGITTNGNAWQFGVLTGTQFRRDPKAYSLADLTQLGQALDAVFRACRDMARTHPTPAIP